MIYNFLVGDGSDLYYQMLQTYSKALAPGTYANRAKQAHCYLTFAVKYNVPYLFPNTVHVCMYSQYLANKFDSLSSVKNYLSGARTWVLEHGGDSQGFICHEQSTMIKSLSKLSTHVVKRAAPLSLHHVSLIVNYLDKARNAPLCIKPCILIGYSCYLRASNLVMSSFSMFGGSHTMLASDVLDHGDSLKVVISSTKTRSSPYSLVIPIISLPEICPVRAWRSYKQHFNPDPSGPAFMLNRVHPLNSMLVVKIMRDALSKCTDLDPAAITMHSLRRGAAQQAEKCGASLADIKQRGGWASNSGLKPYLSH